MEVEQGRSTFRIHVVDTGIGVAPEHRDRLFDEFFQVNNAERNRCKGFGLGLAISRRMARQLGGDLTVESALGHGSRFTLVLPLRACVDGANPYPPAASDAVAPAQQNVGSTTVPVSTPR